MKGEAWLGDSGKGQNNSGGQEKELAVSLTEEQKQKSAALLTKEQWTEIGDSADWEADTGVAQTAKWEPLAVFRQAAWKPEQDVSWPNT